MACWLRVSTAVDIAMGPFLDETTGKDAETGLTITQPDIRLKKNGGAWAQKSAAQTLSHEENGWFECALSTTDTDTLGILIVAIHESGALPVWREFMVVPANVYDSFLSTDQLQVDVKQWNETLVAVPNVAGVPIMDVVRWAGATVATPTFAGYPKVDVAIWLGTAAATPTVAGVPEVDVTHWRGNAVPPTSVSGVPEVDVEYVRGGLQNDLVSGRIDASVGAIQSAVALGVKKNTALANFTFAMFDSAGAPKTGLSSFTAERSIDGGAFSAIAGAVTEIANGFYKVNLTAGELNGDVVALRFASSGGVDSLLTIKTVT